MVQWRAMRLTVFFWIVVGMKRQGLPTSGAETVATSRASLTFCDKDYNDTLVKSLVSMQSNEKVHRCSGVIISKRWVLTAAHCFLKDIEAPRQIKYIKYGLGSGNGHFVEIKFFKTHNQFDIEVRIVRNDQIIRNVHNDIAIVRTIEDMALDGYHDAADIKISEKQPPYGSMAVMCGSYSKCGLPLCVHHEIWYDLRILPFEAYPVFYGIKREDGVIKDCQVRPDSGAPLYYNGCIIGILTTFPVKCDNDQNFDIFTNLAQIASWVAMATFDVEDKVDFSASSRKNSINTIAMSIALYFAYLRL